MHRDKKEDCKITFTNGETITYRIFRKMKVEAGKGFGKSKAGYYHFPILNVSWGSNGFALYILGFKLVITWNPKN